MDTAKLKSIFDYDGMHLRRDVDDRGMSLRKRRTWHTDDSGEDSEGESAAGDAPGADGDNADNNADDTQQKSGEQEKTFTQADVDRIISDRLKRERDKADQEKKQADDKAERERLQKEGEYQQLNEKLTADLATANTSLQTVTEQRDAYKQRVDTMLDVERKDLPDHITALLDKLDPLEQLDWLAENRDSIEQPADEKKKGVPSTPTPDDKKGGDKKKRREEKEDASQRRYQNKF